MATQAFECDPSVTDSEQFLNIRDHALIRSYISRTRTTPAEIFPLADDRARFLCRDYFIPGVHEDVV